MPDIRMAAVPDDRQKLQATQSRSAHSLAEAQALLAGLDADADARRDADADARLSMRSLVEELQVYQTELETQNQELRAAQVAAEKAQRRYELLFEHLPDPALVIDQQGWIEQANGAAQQLFGWDSAGKAPVRRSIWRLGTGSVGEQIRSLLEVAGRQATSAQTEVLLQSSAKTSHYFEIHAHRLPSSYHVDQRYLLLLVNRDAAHALDRYHAQNEQRLSVSPAVIYALAPDTAQVRYVSSNFHALLGTRAPAVGAAPEAWLKLIEPDDREQARDAFDRWSACGTSEPLIRSYRLRQDDGGSIWVEDRTLRCCDSSGHPLELIGSLMNISHQIRVRQALQQQTRDMAQISMAMAHHFQEPTRRMVSLGQVLRQQFAPREVTAEALQVIAFIEEQSRRLNDLVRGVMNFLPRELLHAEAAVVPPPVSAARILTAVIADLDSDSTTQAHSRADIRFSEHLGWVAMDPETLKRIFHIVLENAINQRSPERELQVDVTANTVAGRVEFCFADNGRGIPAEQQEHIFELFTWLATADARDAGGGLPLLRRLVQGCGGQVRIEAGLEGGTAVIFDLPATGSAG